MLSGMIGAVNFGTAKLAYDPIGQVAGKTGTCTGETDKLGCSFVLERLQTETCRTVITLGRRGGKRAAEIAGRVIEHFRTLHSRTRNRSAAASIRSPWRGHCRSSRGQKNKKAKGKKAKIKRQK